MRTPAQMFNMEKIFISYRWSFSVCVLNRKGWKYQDNVIEVLGFDYSSAKLSVEDKIKKKRWTLLKINSVKVLGIAFAFYCRDNYPFVEKEQYAELPLPVVPKEL